MLEGARSLISPAFSAKTRTVGFLDFCNEAIARRLWVYGPNVIKVSADALNGLPAADVNFSS